MIRTIFQNEKLTLLLEELVQIIEEICVWQVEGMCDQGLGGIFNVIINLLRPLRWGICSHQQDSCTVQLINHDRRVEKVQSGYRWKAFNVKMLVLIFFFFFLGKIPLRPTKDMQVSVTSGTWNINRSGAGQLFLSRPGAEKNHNSFKQILVKSGEKETTYNGEQ